MPTPNNSISSQPETSRTHRLEALVQQLEDLSQSQEGALHEPNEALAAFDGEVEQLLTKLYGAEHERLQSYKYATLGEAEAMVNLPESAQLPTESDDFKKSLQQRRQVLQGCISELQEAETVEVEALTGEDREDPPALG
ncbi:hypothetical protein [Candidatus Nitrospira nitrificans]|uniref:Uncharacterized protein n=1 Tax=Candidatus Nitrospira nitrificans TaxID=1742973 RepID=A0A0S4LT10_9BACT|nr:hypothetical protein [Candidatus Nitrospira nitrificans]CUS39802.1 conserved hypothetical protein [Candidatus Nitrospira nitrificans]